MSNVSKLISYDNYKWQQTAVDGMILQTLNTILCDNVSYDDMKQLGISKEQSVKTVAIQEQASEEPGIFLSNLVITDKKHWQNQSQTWLYCRQ